MDNLYQTAVLKLEKAKFRCLQNKQKKTTLKFPSNSKVSQTSHISPFTVRVVFRFCSRYL